MPGYLKRSHVPPILSLPSNITKDLLGQDFFKLYPAAIPDIPAPTTTTSLCVFEIFIIFSVFELKSFYELHITINSNIF
jgi:hypothetical protein